MFGKHLCSVCLIAIGIGAGFCSPPSLLWGQSQEAPKTSSEAAEFLSRLQVRDAAYERLLIKLKISESPKSIPRTHARPIPGQKVQTSNLVEQMKKLKVKMEERERRLKQDPYPRKKFHTLYLFGDEQVYINESDPSMFEDNQQQTFWGDTRYRIVCFSDSKQTDIFHRSGSDFEHFQQKQGIEHRVAFVKLSTGVGFTEYIRQVDRIERADKQITLTGTCNPPWDTRGDVKFTAVYEPSGILRKLTIVRQFAENSNAYFELMTEGELDLKDFPPVAKSAALKSYLITRPRPDFNVEKWREDYRSETLNVSRIDEKDLDKGSILNDFE